MPTVLVTGSAGFIGFHVTRRLVSEGFKVVGADSLNDYYDPRLKVARLEESGIAGNIIENDIISSSRKFPLYSFIKMNLEERDKVKQLFSRYQFDYVIHLAAQTGARHSLKDPYSYIDSNISGFLPILEACRRHPVRHLVYASSSSVYGDNPNKPYAESDFVDHPISLYAATKKANELIAHAYAHNFNIAVTGLRFFTVYGPWGRPDMAYFKFTDAILNNRPVEVYNFGDLERDFTYIDDIVTGVVAVMKKIPEGKPPYKLFNIGNSSPVNLNYFIGVIESLLGKKAEKILKPMQGGDVLSTCADTRMLEEYIGFKPHTTVEEGLKKFTEWYLHEYPGLIK